MNTPTITKHVVKNGTLGLLLLMIISGCEKPSETKTTAQDNISISGIELGMDQQTAISVMESRGIFKWTSADGTVVVGTEMKCLDQVYFKPRDEHSPCTHLTLDSVKLAPNSRSRDWIVAEISYDQIFENAIHLDVWKESVEELVGTLQKSDHHYAEPINVSYDDFIGIVNGDQGRFQDLADGSPFFSDLEEKLMTLGCKEPLQFVEATAYYRGSMVFAYELELIDLQLKCQEQLAREQSKIDSSKEFKDQIDFD